MSILQEIELWNPWMRNLMNSPIPSVPLLFQSRVVDSNQGCTNKTPLLNFFFFIFPFFFLTLYPLFSSLNTSFWQYVNLTRNKGKFKTSNRAQFFFSPIQLRIRESFNNYTHLVIMKVCILLSVSFWLAQILTRPAGECFNQTYTMLLIACTDTEIN